jgi:hypothetical protein
LLLALLNCPLKVTVILGLTSSNLHC